MGHCVDGGGSECCIVVVTTRRDDFRLRRRWSECWLRCEDDEEEAMGEEATFDGVVAQWWGAAVRLEVL